MTFVGLMHQFSPNELLAGAELVHHADTLEVSPDHRVGMMLESSTGELLTRLAFMHHEDQEHGALRHYAVLKGLNGFVT